MKEAQEGKRSVFFVEAAHFVYGSFLGYLWTLTRLFVKIGSGRKRFNVLGALHAVPRQVIVETNGGYINAETVCPLLCQIARRGFRTLVTLVMDNARYQKCKLVRSLADEIRHRTVVPTGLLAEPQLDRTVLEVREKAGSGVALP